VDKANCLKMNLPIFGNYNDSCVSGNGASGFVNLIYENKEIVFLWQWTSKKKRTFMRSNWHVPCRIQLGLSGFSLSQASLFIWMVKCIAPKAKCAIIGYENSLPKRGHI